MIPEAAVEAAAEWLPHSGECEVRPERDCTCWQPRVNLMRAALEAAAPHMLREAWFEGFSTGVGWGEWFEGSMNTPEPDNSNSNPYGGRA